MIRPARSFRLSQVEVLRNQLKSNTDLIDLYDLKSNRSYRKTIRSIAKTSLSSAKFSAFLNRLIDYLRIERAMETGTCLGINALYMAGTGSMKKLVTIEASPLLASLSTKMFNSLLQHKISVKEGTIQECFESEVVSLKPELCFIDADHRASAVHFCVNALMQNASEVTCIVIHDIYWSEDMHEAWQQLVNDERFSLSIDIFQAGILFPNLEMPKQHFILRF